MSANGDDGVLADVTNKVKGMQVNEDNQKRVHDAKWVKPQAFDYDTYNADPKAQRTAAPAGGAEAAEEENVPTWAANAIKYEWNGQFGDVGPEHEDLEKMLFGTDSHNEKGKYFSK